MFFPDRINPVMFYGHFIPDAAPRHNSALGVMKNYMQTAKSQTARKNLKRIVIAPPKAYNLSAYPKCYYQTLDQIRLLRRM